MRTRSLVTTSLVTTSLVSALLVVAALSASPPAWAQAGVSQPTLLRPATSHPFPTRAVWPHELMTYQERYDTWRKMREARSSAERYDIWAKKISELESRAAEHGLALRDHGPMMMAQEDHAAPRWNGAFAPEQPAAPYGPGYGFGPGYGPGPGYGHGPGPGFAPERPAAPGGWYGPRYGGGGYGPGAHPFAPIGR